MDCASRTTDGQVFYGIYLLHVPALILVMRCLPGLTLALKVCIFLFITALLSFVSFQLLENPMIELGKRLTQSARAPCFNAPESIGLNAKLEAGLCYELQIE